MFYQPQDIEEALAIRAELAAAVMPVCGGTDIVVALNRTGVGAEHFLDLSHVAGYSDVRAEGNGWWLGGGATFDRIATALSDDENGGVRMLSDAAMSIGGPAIRNRGTIAGNLGTASPAGDACVALLAVDAGVELGHATRGRRVVPIVEYFTGFRETALSADELITGVRIPSGWRTGWQKIGKRGATNISVVCCGVGLSPGGHVRIAFGSVAPTVMRAREAEGMIEDCLAGVARDAAKQGGGGSTALPEDVIEAVGASAMKAVSPIDDHRASATYRRAMCGVLVRRLLREW